MTERDRETTFVVREDRDGNRSFETSTQRVLHDQVGHPVRETVITHEREIVEGNTSRRDLQERSTHLQFHDGATTSETHSYRDGGESLTYRHEDGRGYAVEHVKAIDGNNRASEYTRERQPGGEWSEPRPTDHQTPSGEPGQQGQLGQQGHQEQQGQLGQQGSRPAGLPDPDLPERFSTQTEHVELPDADEPKALARHDESSAGEADDDRPDAPHASADATKPDPGAPSGPGGGGVQEDRAPTRDDTGSPSRSHTGDGPPPSATPSAPYNESTPTSTSPTAAPAHGYGPPTGVDTPAPGPADGSPSGSSAYGPTATDSPVANTSHPGPQTSTASAPTHDPQSTSVPAHPSDPPADGPPTPLPDPVAPQPLDDGANSAPATLPHPDAATPQHDTGVGGTVTTEHATSTPPPSTYTAPVAPVYHPTQHESYDSDGS